MPMSYEEAAEWLADKECPECKAIGTLRVEVRLRALPLGTWSLSGSQMKFSAQNWPYLVCKAEGCEFMQEANREE